jgi:hypothetical protein
MEGSGNEEARPSGNRRRGRTREGSGCTRIRDTARVERITRSLEEAGLDAVIGSLPAHVLMLTGYWPLVGNALAVVDRDGRVAIVAPEDERELAEKGWADELHTFRPVSPSELKALDEVVREPLAAAARSLGVEGRRIGYLDGRPEDVITLLAGFRAEVAEFAPRDLGSYDRRMRFVVESGEFRVIVGSSGAGGIEAGFQVIE